MSIQKEYLPLPLNLENKLLEERTMKSYDIVKATAPHSDWEMWFENKQGELFHIEWGTKWDYQLHIDLDTMTANDSSTDCPTLNDLCDSKEWTKRNCYDEITLDYSDKYPHCDSVKEFGDIDIDTILNDVKEKGMDISLAALIHCIFAWKHDFKSGFRDDENGVHLFAPCGCNPLVLRISTLHPLCEDWQITYSI